MPRPRHIIVSQGEWGLLTVGLTLGAALLTVALIVALRPWLIRYALARPSARGLHTVPTPQGGGIAVLLACLFAAALGAWLVGLNQDDGFRLAAVLAAATGLAIVGLFDDIRPLPALPRLGLQLGLMGVGVAALPDGTRVLPFIPLLAERGLLVLGGAWFVNLTNFMDGMDWMTVVEMVPISAFLTTAWTMGDLPATGGLLMLGLLGGLIGFAPFNRPVARLFLGDVGSLPIGLLSAYALMCVAGLGSRGFVAALLLALYSIADTGLTLLWRMRQRHRVWEPHRHHFYQVAVARGLAVPHVVLRVAATNVALACLAWVSLRSVWPLQFLSLGLGSLLVGATLFDLNRLRGKQSET